MGVAQTGPTSSDRRGSGKIDRALRVAFPGRSSLRALGGDGQQDRKSAVETRAPEMDDPDPLVLRTHQYPKARHPPERL